VQGLSANIVNRASIALARAYKAKRIPAIIVANVHDELLVSCKKGFEDVAAKIMQEVLENNYKLSVALKAVPVIGCRYGEIK
jgi:DNA polymerase I-like protein with 3'-5' exonuclease and polymerase domains